MTTYFPADLYHEGCSTPSERVYVKKLGDNEPRVHYAVTRDDRFLRVRTGGLGYRLATTEELARDFPSMGAVASGG